MPEPQGLRHDGVSCQPPPWRLQSAPGTTGARVPYGVLISRRYEKGPMILTSNQSFGAWGEVFGDRIIATAILDRETGVEW
jgi:IstB-like ATP binding protein